MTKAFQQIIEQGPQINFQMNIVFGLVLIFVLIISLKSNKFLKAAFLNLVLVVLGVFIAGAIFDAWWHEVVSNIKSPEDEKWLCDHDGGLLIVSFEMFLKGFGCLIIALTISIVKCVRKKGEKKMSNKATEAGGVATLKG